MRTKVWMLLLTLLTAGGVMLPLGGFTSSGSEPAQAAMVTPVVAPVVTSFTPIHAAPGATVIITGDHLAKATSVKFGVGGWSGNAAGVEAASFQVVSDTQIEAVVPSGSRWGNIQVTTPGGTAETSGVTPVNYFWPDNLHIASGNTMYAVGDGSGRKHSGCSEMSTTLPRRS